LLVFHLCISKYLKMKKRININETEPQAIKAMYGLVAYLGTVQLSKTLIELMKIRASQINGCAYCIDMHTKDALKNGETTQRIFLLNGWHETTLYTPEERAALAITEEITLIQNGGLSNKTYLDAQKYFNENQIAQIIMAIVTINAWNRIAISTQLQIGQ